MLRRRILRRRRQRPRFLTPPALAAAAAPSRAGGRVQIGRRVGLGRAGSGRRSCYYGAARRAALGPGAYGVDLALPPAVAPCPPAAVER